MPMDTIERWVRITPEKAIANGLSCDLGGTKGMEALNTLYHNQIEDYPKYYKMDPLSKLGFVASELMLKGEEGRFEGREDRAVILSNKSASLADDKAFERTIIDRSDFFASPSLFVYTLPNIVTGEIAIRNKYFGETSFLVLPEFNARSIAEMTVAAFEDPCTESVLGGWLECEFPDLFDALLFIACRGISVDTLTKEITSII